MMKNEDINKFMVKSDVGGRDVYSIYDHFMWSLRVERAKWFMMLRSWTEKESNFIREFSMPQRRITGDIYQLHKQIMHYGADERRDCFLSLCSYMDKEYFQVPGKRGRNRPDYKSFVGIEKLFFDIDASMENMKEALNEVRMLTKFFGKQVTVLFSGGKGFHVFVHLNVPWMNAEQIRVFQEKVESRLCLKYSDSSVYGDSQRVSRIPYTVHPKSRLQCVPISIDVINDITVNDILFVSSLFQTPKVINHGTINFIEYSNRLGLWSSL